MSDEQMEQLFGPAAPYDWVKKRGETLRFKVDDVEKSGKILWVSAPGKSYEGGPLRPLTYWVDTGKGMPTPVYPGEVVE